MASDQNPPDPGWYPDPTSQGKIRYWDGRQWTDRNLEYDGGLPVGSESAGLAAPKPKLYRRRWFQVTAGVFAFLFIATALTSESDTDNPDQATSTPAGSASPDVAITVASVESSTPSTTVITVASVESSTPSTTVPEPEGQELFLKIIADFQSEYRAAKTDLQRADIRLSRDEALCRALPDLQATDWIGKVVDARGNSRGDAYIDIEIARHVNVATWNNRVSDVLDRTMIPRSDPLYPALVSLNKGDTVAFSGRFLSRSRECIVTSNLTETFAMSRPDFIFRFTAVEKR